MVPLSFVALHVQQHQQAGIGGAIVRLDLQGPHPRGGRPVHVPAGVARLPGPNARHQVRVRRNPAAHLQIALPARGGAIQPGSVQQARIYADGRPGVQLTGLRRKAQQIAAGQRDRADLIAPAPQQRDLRAPPHLRIRGEGIDPPGEHLVSAQVLLLRALLGRTQAQVARHARFRAQPGQRERLFVAQHLHQLHGFSGKRGLAGKTAGIAQRAQAETGQKKGLQKGQHEKRSQEPKRAHGFGSVGTGTARSASSTTRRAASA